MCTFTMINESLRYIEGDSVYCQGNDSHDSHPLIYLNFRQEKIITCPYCGAKFKKMNDLNSQELVLVDGSGYIFRAYYALPPMYRSDGLPVNATFGFCNMLLKLVEDIQSEKGGKVSIAVIFDAARETFRNKIYPEYKANRSDPPDDLKPQFEIIKKVPDFFNLKSIQSIGLKPMI